MLAFAGLAAVFFGADRLAQKMERRLPSPGLRRLGEVGLGLLVAVLAGWTATRIRSFNAFMGMAAWIPMIGAGASWVVWKSWRSGRTSSAGILVLCMSVVSFELLIRILLNARPLGYGVFLMVPGALLLLYSAFAFLPALLRRWGSNGRLHVWGFAVFFAIVAQKNFTFSLRQYHGKNVAVPTARGTLRLRPDQANALVQLLGFFQDKRDYALLVLPEGNLINFLLDSIPRTYSYAYVPGLLKTPAQEDRIIRELREIPIDYVLIVTRWTTEFGFPIIGTDYFLRAGQAILRDFKVVARFGPPPFNDQGVFGVVVLERIGRQVPAGPDRRGEPPDGPKGP